MTGEIGVEDELLHKVSSGVEQYILSWSRGEGEGKVRGTDTLELKFELNFTLFLYLHI